LLQVIPPTAKKLAKAEGISDYHPNLLYNPYMNIRLGVRYLKDLLVEYENDPMYVLANYNAGPKPAKRWQAAGKDIPWDRRAEEISYWETRDYVKRCLGNYWVYSEVWNR
ncbi:MAG: transglycosylase SLT domain-containing protein, partial [Fibrobacter sp.]|nr:transglycosylase SLT domain-containing protein [Fibrobacter sp.]